MCFVADDFDLDLCQIRCLRWIKLGEQLRFVEQLPRSGFNPGISFENPPDPDLDRSSESLRPVAGCAGSLGADLLD